MIFWSSDPCARGCWSAERLPERPGGVGSVCAGVLGQSKWSPGLMAAPCARGCWGGTSLFFEEMLVDLKNRKLDVT